VRLHAAMPDLRTGLIVGKFFAAPEDFIPLSDVAGEAISGTKGTSLARLVPEFYFGSLCTWPEGMNQRAV
jgi:hypothetical protein